VFSCIFKIKFIEMYNRAIVLLLKERKIITDLGVTNWIDMKAMFVDREWRNSCNI